MLKQVEEVREELMEEVKQVHAKAEVRTADLYCLLKTYLSSQEAVVKEENEIRRQGWVTCKADFKAFKLAISPRLEALLFSKERLASVTDSPLLLSQLSLHLVNLPSQVASTP